VWALVPCSTVTVVRCATLSQPWVARAPSANPDFAIANLDGATNTVPSFVTANGPIREARFILNQKRLDGGVHNLFTIAGRSDAPGCNVAQPNFTQQLANGNVIFRIPTPLFGLGLVENTPDGTLQANLSANQTAKLRLGIGGRFNTIGNDGTITRFGWKAQNKSLALFAGEALNVELGVSNENFLMSVPQFPAVYLTAPQKIALLPPDRTAVRGPQPEPPLKWLPRWRISLYSCGLTRRPHRQYRHLSLRTGFQFPRLRSPTGRISSAL
jgi:hypothetical protein